MKAYYVAYLVKYDLTPDVAYLDDSSDDGWDCTCEDALANELEMLEVFLTEAEAQAYKEQLEKLPRYNGWFEVVEIDV